MLSAPLLLIALILAHFLCDYPLQGDFLAKAKNHRFPLPGVPWPQALGAHAAIHGGAVALLTGIWWLGMAEFAAHAVVDWLKCNDDITFNDDQVIHLWCKGLWWAIAIGAFA